jgi:hypothetical protein
VCKPEISAMTLLEGRKERTPKHIVPPNLGQSSEEE